MAKDPKAPTPVSVRIPFLRDTSNTFLWSFDREFLDKAKEAKTLPAAQSIYLQKSSTSFASKAEAEQYDAVVSVTFVKKAVK